MAWPEITRFVKDVVTGQKLLSGHHLITADLHEGDGVVQRRMQGIVCWISDSHQKRDVRLTGGQATAERVEGLPLPLQVRGAEEKIPWWIPPERELGRDQQVRLAARGLDQAVEALQNAGGIAQQVAHNRIDLGQGNAHRHSRVGGIESIKIVLQQQRQEAFRHLMSFLLLFHL